MARHVSQQSGSDVKVGLVHDDTRDNTSATVCSSLTCRKVAERRKTWEAAPLARPNRRLQLDQDL